MGLALILITRGDFDLLRTMKRARPRRDLVLVEKARRRAQDESTPP
jgi:hypothetical protein